MLQYRNASDLGYKRQVHAGFLWLASAEAQRFLLSINDWSPEELNKQKGWSVWIKKTHTLYVTRDEPRYFIKFYRPSKKGGVLHPEKARRAKREFYHSILAHQKGILTILPVAMGQKQRKHQPTIIIYPYIEDVVGIDGAYRKSGNGSLTIKGRQWMEKMLGRVIRQFIDEGMYPVDVNLDNFVTRDMRDDRPLVYWIDLERVRFAFWAKHRKGMWTLAKLLARLEWLRMSGGNVRRSSMMRIVYGYALPDGAGPIDKQFVRAVARAAALHWNRRGFHARGNYRIRSMNQTA